MKRFIELEGSLYNIDDIVRVKPYSDNESTLIRLRGDKQDTLFSVAYDKVKAKIADAT